MDGCPATDGEIQKATDEVKVYIRALKKEVDDFTEKNITIKDKKELAELNDSLNRLDQNLKRLLDGIKQNRLPAELEEDVRFLFYGVTDLRFKYVETIEPINFDDTTFIIE